MLLIVIFQQQDYLNMTSIWTMQWFCECFRRFYILSTSYKPVSFLALKGAVHQAIQVLKPYKSDKNITWVYAITERLRENKSQNFSSHT